MVDSVFNLSPRTLPPHSIPSPPSVPQQYDGTYLPLTPERDSGTPAPGTCNASPCVNSRADISSLGNSLLPLVALAFLNFRAEEVLSA